MKLGCSPYLNALPLTRGLDAEPGVELSIASPARLADLLRAERLDAALVSSSEYFCGAYRIVPVGAISSISAAADATLHARVPYTHLRRVALSAASRSTNLLLQMLLHRLRPGAAVHFEVRPEDTLRSLAEFDACLLIGDCAIGEADVAEYRYGLAQLWHAHTGMPMVFTLWLARPEADPRLMEVLSRARDRGLAELPLIAHEAAAVRGLDEAAALKYISETLDYTWTEEHAKSLRHFGAELCELGLIGASREILYFGEPGPAEAAVPSSQAT